MIALERSDGTAEPELADSYGLAVTFACEGGKRAISFCSRPIAYGHLVPDFGPGIWGLQCKMHSAGCRRSHPDHVVAVKVAS